MRERDAKREGGNRTKEGVREREEGGSEGTEGGMEREEGTEGGRGKRKGSQNIEVQNPEPWGKEEVSAKYKKQKHRNKVKPNIKIWQILLPIRTRRYDKTIERESWVINKNSHSTFTPFANFRQQILLNVKKTVLKLSFSLALIKKT